MLHEAFSHAELTLYRLTSDLIRFLGGLFQAESALAAENLFLRKRLARYQERQVRPRRASDATQLTMVILGKLYPISILSSFWIGRLRMAGAITPCSY